MNSGFVPTRNRHAVLGVSGVVSLIIAVFWLARGDLWSRGDYWISDSLYQIFLIDEQRLPVSDRLLFITVNDDSLKALSTPYLDRPQLTRVIHAIADLSPEAVVFNFVLAGSTDTALDQALASALQRLNRTFLPVGLETTQPPATLMASQQYLLESLQSSLLPRPPGDTREGPLYGRRILTQAPIFMQQAGGLGHINTTSDGDGVYRHLPGLIRINEYLLPTLSLAVFLGVQDIPQESVEVAWGRHLRIPSENAPGGGKYLDIPIDPNGRLLVPVMPFWNSGFEKLAAHDLLDYLEDPDIRGNLEDLFAGKIVWLADISSAGGGDVGPTAVEVDSPLINFHASMLNALLTQNFLRYGSPWLVILATGLGGVMLTLGGLSKYHGMLHWVGIILFSGLVALAIWSTLDHQLLPLFGMAISLGTLFIAVELTRKLGLIREKYYLENAFSFYLPPPVLDEVLRKPEFLRLGGQEKTVTILFSDLASFTTLSEGMEPQALVALLNRYMSAMTEITQAHAGIVDKYLGDGLMAEFGIPLDLPDHADQAVAAGLRMLERLEQLNASDFAHLAKPLACRIGIHTGPVVVGNMGAKNTFDYTVIGDSVNLAARIEAENKRFGTRLLVSEFTHSLLTPERFLTRPVDTVVVKGKTQPVTLFEIAARRDAPLSDQRRAFFRCYSQAYTAYHAGDLNGARAGFETALRLQEDKVTRLWLTRIDTQLPPGKGTSLTAQKTKKQPA